jgi:GNAT superfamily N-acetyltransferase
MTWEIAEAMIGDERWLAGQTLGDTLGQSSWLSFTAEWHRSSHLLVATMDAHALGFLSFVIQTIGPDMGCPPVTVNGVTLIEAKIMAFGVTPEWRKQGVGRALQEAAIRHARDLGCYQVRSHSSGDADANHRLKLAMGFAIHPIVRGEDNQGCYFLLPLRTSIS